MAKQVTQLKQVKQIGDTTAPATSAKQDDIISSLASAFGSYGLYA